MAKSKHVHVYASNLDTPANELQCRNCNDIVDVKTGEEYNAKHHGSRANSGQDKPKKG